MARTKKEDVLEANKEVVSYKQPCDVGQNTYIPYWEEDKDKNKKYGYDTYKVNSLCGCGDVWICTVADKDGRRSCYFEPNTEIFFTENDEMDGIFTAYVGVGNVTIKTYEPVLEEPNETPAETTAETVGA